jgi:cytochrome c biogenesis protein CcmG/thiol:disulfide interchange protein DsbE
MKVARSSPVVARLVAAALALAVAGCGGTEGGNYGGKHPDYTRMLAGSPAPLAALHAEADELLPGGRDAYEGRIAALHGYPVVVNIWASWCGSCRLEFPLFQRVAAREGRRVAFLAIDTMDSDDAARTFLKEAPVPYPSYTDPDASLAESVGASRGYPETAFYNRRGTLVYLRPGMYKSAAELSADIQRYAVEGKGSG